MTDITLVVLAKSPVAGRVKTRLCPPLSPAEAAKVATAALRDTLDAVAVPAASRRVLVLDGPTSDWLAGHRVEVVPQRSGTLGERLAGAFADVGGPAVLVGMDTPQVTPDLLAGAMARLETSRTDAVLGLADDGGFWAIGLREPDDRVFAGVPMSTAATGFAQLARLRECGARVALLPHLRDVDTIDDARAVAHGAFGTRFARVLRSIDRAAVAVAAR